MRVMCFHHRSSKDKEFFTLWIWKFGKHYLHSVLGQNVRTFRKTESSAMPCLINDPDLSFHLHFNRKLTKWNFRLGAQVNYQDPTNKCTPLHYAITASNREAIRLLLDAGAKTDIRNSDVCFFLYSFEWRSLVFPLEWKSIWFSIKTARKSSFNQILFHRMDFQILIYQNG